MINYIIVNRCKLAGLSRLEDIDIEEVLGRFWALGILRILEPAFGIANICISEGRVFTVLERSEQNSFPWWCGSME